MAVEDIKRVQDTVARESKQLVYMHYNLMVGCDKGSTRKAYQLLENSFGRLGIHISKRAYNQLELPVYLLSWQLLRQSVDYDRFLTSAMQPPA